MKNWLIWKDPDAGKDWRQEEKGTTEDEVVGWHHRLNGHKFGLTPGVGDGQGSLACCSPWGQRESDMTEQLNWTESISQHVLLKNDDISWRKGCESGRAEGLWAKCAFCVISLCFLDFSPPVWEAWVVKPLPLFLCSQCWPTLKADSKADVSHAASFPGREGYLLCSSPAAGVGHTEEARSGPYSHRACVLVKERKQ